MFGMVDSPLLGRIGTGGKEIILCELLYVRISL